MKLSKSTMYAINWLYSGGHDVKDIAEELNISEDSIKAHIEKNHTQLNSGVLADKSKPVKSSKDLMIRHTKEKKTNNVSIMTREASEYNDHMKKKISDKNDKNQEHIFRPSK